MTKIFPDSRIVCGTLDSLRFVWTQNLLYNAFLSETTVELLQELNTDISKETKIIAPEIRMLDQIVDH